MSVHPFIRPAVRPPVTISDFSVSSLITRRTMLELHEMILYVSANNRSLLDFSISGDPEMRSEDQNIHVL